MFDRSLIVRLALVAAGTTAASAGHAEARPFEAPACSAGQTAAKGGEPTTADMTGRPEGLPHGTIAANGIPIGWARAPRVWRGNAVLPGWKAAVSTGMIYEADRGNSARNARIQIRDLQIFVKPRATMRWCLLDSQAAPDGGFFRENFEANATTKGDIRREPSGGISVRPVAGHTFHFWGKRSLLPDSGLAGLYVQYRARLTADDPAAPNDLGNAAYLGAASADYWKELTSPAGHVGVLNEDAAIARFKRITRNWRLFTMNTNGGPAKAPPAN
jgi:hypothetical protein